MGRRRRTGTCPAGSSPATPPVPAAAAGSTRTAAGARASSVDRVGWGRADERFIDVRFLLLKGTYEERIFHTLIQRDQWFQILLGSKRRELGQIQPGDEDDSGAPGSDTNDDPVEDALERRRLTPEEKAA